MTRQQLKNVLHSQLFLVFGIIILIFIAVNFGRTWIKSAKIKGEIVTLEQQIHSLGDDNSKLIKLIQHLNSMAYIEEKARTDLGLKKEGESIVVIPDNQSLTPTALNLAPEYNSQSLSNPAKWWTYFFSSKTKIN